MANEHLVQLVRDELAHGKTEEELHESLCKGWAKEEVNAALAHIRLERYPFRFPTDDNFARQRPRSSPIAGILIVVIMLGFVFAAAYEGYTHLVQSIVTHSSGSAVSSATPSLPPNSVEIKPTNEPYPFLHRVGDTAAEGYATSTNSTQSPTPAAQ